MRVGRPRKPGHREPNGRIKRDAAHAKKLALGERYQVANQPHRRDFPNSHDELLESPLGRFVLRHSLDRALYRGGLAFGTLVRRYLSAKARPADIREAPSGSGADLPEEKARRLAQDVTRIEGVLRPLSPLGFSAVQAMSVYEREPPPGSEIEAVGVLFGLAKLLGMLR